MRTAKSSPTLLNSIVLVTCLAGAGAAMAATPEAENGRYTLSTTSDGALRLDTRTGAVSMCSNSGAGWACYAVPDERAAIDAEIGRLQADIVRLQAENEKLRADLASREPTVSGKIEEPLPKSDSLKKSEPRVAEAERKIEIPLPSDRDMDRIMSFLEQAWRRLIEMAGRVQRDVGGKI
jgi:septal ring factor EnvC (AmiA/AmiB activator)